jgi:hypothetical protein
MADEFPGLTIYECPSACRAERCCISGDGVCTHPLKGGLHSAHQTRPDVLRRYARAKFVVDMQMAERRAAAQRAEGMR